MIRKFMRETFRNLGDCRSGNATILVAMGMPVLIGGAGLGVDMTQWYMWKRELQFAVDQAAIAGAYAASDTDTADTFEVRAAQEFQANLAVTDPFNSTPVIQLANYAAGTNNSVAVSATASKLLPFSSFITGDAANVHAYAQASFDEGTTFTSCLIAVDEDDRGSVTIGGNSVLTASCGIAALSRDANSITVSGSPEVDAGWVISAGGIDDWFNENTDDVVLEYMDGLYDPYAELSPPNPTESQIARTYSCSAQGDTTFADEAITNATAYTYWSGPNTRNLTSWDNPNPTPSSSVTSNTNDQVVPSGTVTGTTTTSETVWRDLGGSGSNKRWEQRVSSVTTTYSDVRVVAGGTAGSVRPGTYAGGIHVSCNTAFAPGVYNIVGGVLQINGQHEVTGAGVMFVLYEGASLSINGGADINLTAMTTSDLIAAGVSAEQANRLAGMLVFEDRNGPGAGSSGHSLNGNADTVLNGTIYTPRSTMFFAGTASVTSQCLMIASANIVITGTTNMATFCPSDATEDTAVASTDATIRLVA